MNWFLLTLIYLVFLVTAEIINKKSVSNDDVDETIFGAGVQGATGVTAIILSLFIGWKYDFDIKLLPLFLGMGITYFIAVSTYFQSLKKMDLSLVAILFSVGSVFSLILGFVFYKEPISPLKILGVFLIIASVVVASLDKRKLNFNKYSMVVVMSSFFYALGAIFDKKLNSYGNPLSYMGISFGIACASMFVVYYKRTFVAFRETFRRKNFWKGIAINGPLYAFGFWALFEAYNRGGEVSRMYPMTLSVSVILPVLAIVFLKERKNLLNKIVALGIMILGLWSLGN